MFKWDRLHHFEFCHFVLNYNLNRATLAALATTARLSQTDETRIWFSLIAVSWIESKIDDTWRVE